MQDFSSVYSPNQTGRVPVCINSVLGCCVGRVVSSRRLSHKHNTSSATILSSVSPSSSVSSQPASPQQHERRLPQGRAAQGHLGGAGEVQESGWNRVWGLRAGRIFMIRQSSIISMSIQQSNCCIVLSILGEHAKKSGAIVIYLFEIYVSFLSYWSQDKYHVCY